MDGTGGTVQDRPTLPARIPYGYHRLDRYEADQDRNDAVLKQREACAVGAFLRAQGCWGQLRRVLDVGTCTGRYLRFLSDAVRPGGILVGIDKDDACVAYARAHTRSGPDRPLIEVIHGDVLTYEGPWPGAPYEVISCMMGTLSHFGILNTEKRPDPLQRALRRMASLLHEKGWLLLGTWSAEACAERRFLSLYDDAETERLVADTPSPCELQARIRAAGLIVVGYVHVDRRIDLWCCTAGPTRVG